MKPRRRSPRGRLPGLLVILAAAGCSDSTAPPGPLPDVLSVTVNADSGSIFRTLEISLSAPGGVQVDYWTAAAPRLRVTQSELASEHAVFLPGLRPGEQYNYEIRAPGADRLRAPLFEGQLTTDTLPSDLASLRFTSFGQPTSRLTMLELHGPPFFGWVAVDGDGAVVWFRRGQPQSFTRRADGDLAMLQVSQIDVVHPDLGLVARLPATTDMQMHHEVIATPANTLLFLARDTATFDGTVWVGDAIWEWDPESGALNRRWRAADFLSPDRDLGPKSRPDDWLHANSLAIGPRGNVLISLPALNQVISIAPGFGSLEWRLGGPNATIVPENGSDFWFQHTAAEISPDRVLMFDDGRDRPAGLYSRALELRLDRDRGVATTAWQFRPDPDIYAPVVGSARRLANGNTVADFGTPPGFVGASGPVAVYETMPDGTVQWLLRVSGAETVNYRATPLDDLAGEVVVDERPAA